MAKKLTTTAKIRAYVMENPNASSRDVATMFNVKPGYVSSVKWQLKKRPAKQVAKANLRLKRLMQGAGRPTAHPILDTPLIMEYTPPQSKVDINNIKVGDVVGGLKLTNVGDGKVRWVADDPVNSPSHYKDGGIETIDYIEAKGLGYHLGNAVKYISRAGKKGTNQGLEDLKKAQWYLARAIEKNEYAPPSR